MSRPCNINLFQWNRKCFFLRHVELNPRFLVMTFDEMKSPWIDQKSARASASSVVSVGWEVLCWNLRSLRLAPALDWIPGIRSLFLTILLYHLQMGRWIHHLFVWSGSLSCWFFEDKYLMRRTIPTLPCLPPEYILSKFFPRSAHSQERFLVILSCRIDEVLIDLLEKSDDIQSVLQMVTLALWMVLQIVFHKESSRLNRIPLNQPTIFHPIPIATMRQTFLRLPCVALFQQDLSSRIDEVSKFGNSMINLHRICQIPSNCQCKWLSAFLTARETFSLSLFRLLAAPSVLTNFSASRVKILFFTRIRLNPLSSEILYHDCVPVILSWFTSFIVWSAVIKSPNFSARSGASPVRLLQGAFVILVLKQTSQSRSFGEVSKNTVLSRYHSGELCADARNSVSFKFSLKSFKQSGRSANGSSESFLSLLFFLWFWISENGTSVLVASSSLRSDTELEAGSNSSLVALAASFLKESCDTDADELLAGLVDNPCTTRGTKLSMTVFSSWVNRGLRKACPAIGLLAFPPVIARLRTDWDCERTLVPLRGFAPPRLQSTLLSRFWTFLLCPSLLSLILFCSSCSASMLLNQLRIRDPLVSLKWVPASLFQ